MIVQCPACRALVDIREARLEEGARRAGLACPACAEVTWLPSGGPSPTVAAPSRSTAREPTAPEPTASEPTDLGATAPGSPPMPSSEDADDLAAALRSLDVAEDGAAIRDDVIALLGRWHDEAGHKSLVQRAHLADQLAVLGQAYRVVLEHRKGDPAATRGRELVLAAAMARLTPSGADDLALARTKRTMNLVVGFLCLVLLGATGWLLLRPGALFGPTPAPLSPEGDPFVR